MRESRESHRERDPSHPTVTAPSPGLRSIRRVPDTAAVLSRTQSVTFKVEEGPMAELEPGSPRSPERRRNPPVSTSSSSSFDATPDVDAKSARSAAPTLLVHVPLSLSSLSHRQEAQYQFRAAPLTAPPSPPRPPQSPREQSRQQQPKAAIIQAPALRIVAPPDGPQPWEVALNPLLLCCGGLNGMHLQLGDEIDVLEAQCAEIRRQNVQIKKELSKLRQENDDLRSSNDALSSKARARAASGSLRWLSVDSSGRNSARAPWPRDHSQSAMLTPTLSSLSPLSIAGFGPGRREGRERQGRRQPRAAGEGRRRGQPQRREPSQRGEGRLPRGGSGRGRVSGGQAARAGLSCDRMISRPPVTPPPGRAWDGRLFSFPSLPFPLHTHPLQ